MCFCFCPTVALAGSADTAAGPPFGQGASPRDDFRWSSLGSDFAAWPNLQRSIKSVPREGADENGQSKRRILLGKRPNGGGDDDYNERMAGGFSSKRKTMLGKREWQGETAGRPLGESFTEAGSLRNAGDKRQVMLGKRPEAKTGKAAWGKYDIGNRNDDIQSPWQRVRLGKRPVNGGDGKRRILLGKRPDNEIADDTKRRIMLGKRPSDENAIKRTIMLGKRPDVGESKRRILLGKRPDYGVAGYMKRRILLGKRRVPRQNSNAKPPALQRTLLGKRAAVSGLDSTDRNGRVRLGRSQDNGSPREALVKRPFGGSSYKWDLPSAPNVRDERR